MSVVLRVGRNVAQVRLNAWFGARTVSCLHHDPDHNLLCQVVGSKSVRLYHSSESHRLYPHAGMMSNTSQVRRVCGQQARTVRVCLLLLDLFQCSAHSQNKGYPTWT